jgi:hypothetical protein
MATIVFELPRGARAQAKRDGFTFFKHKREKFYRIRMKSNPESVENNQHFGQTMKMLSQAYKSLTEEDRNDLILRMEKEKSTTNAWVHFRREYFRGRTPKSPKGD